MSGRKDEWTTTTWKGDRLMRQQYIFIFSLTIALLSGAIQAQDKFSDLKSAIVSGNVVISNIHGNGASSGSAIEAVIENRTNSKIRIYTQLDDPLYLGNETSQSSQNMLAFEVYGEGGTYYSDGTNSFIELSPNQRMRVDMTAYCTDYYKDNPSYNDRFKTAATPDDIEDIANKIANYTKRSSVVDITTGAQVALWLGQGLSPNEIKETFPFSSRDQAIAKEILRE